MSQAFCVLFLGIPTITRENFVSRLFILQEIIHLRLITAIPNLPNIFDLFNWVSVIVVFDQRHVL